MCRVILVVLTDKAPGRGGRGLSCLQCTRCAQVFGLMRANGERLSRELLEAVAAWFNSDAKRSWSEAMAHIDARYVGRGAVGGGAWRVTPTPQDRTDRLVATACAAGIASGVARYWSPRSSRRRSATRLPAPPRP
jgi:hypothetical protein